jgi:hypothetical protein
MSSHPTMTNHANATAGHLQAHGTQPQTRLKSNNAREKQETYFDKHE